MNITEISTKELTEELAKRKGIQHVIAVLYQEFSVIGKYRHRGIEFPEKYELLIIKHVS